MKVRKIICPRCQGNGFIKLKKSVDNPTIIIHQCSQCNSQGEIEMNEQRLKNAEIEQKLLTVRHIKQLEKEIENLLKQKATLQDDLNKFSKGEIKND